MEVKPEAAKFDSVTIAKINLLTLHIQRWPTRISLSPEMRS